MKQYSFFIQMLGGLCFYNEFTFNYLALCLQRCFQNTMENGHRWWHQRLMSNLDKLSMYFLIKLEHSRRIKCNSKWLSLEIRFMGRKLRREKDRLKLFRREIVTHRRQNKLYRNLYLKIKHWKSYCWITQIKMIIQR